MIRVMGLASAVCAYGCVAGVSWLCCDGGAARGRLAGMIIGERGVAGKNSAWGYYQAAALFWIKSKSYPG